MTTTVSFATADCIVIGCDSLATSTSLMIDARRLLSECFEQDESGKWAAKKSQDGQLVIGNADLVFDMTEDVPFHQMPSVTKIFDLNPAAAGLLFAGIASIGNKTVNMLVAEFTKPLTCLWPNSKGYMNQSSLTFRYLISRTHW
jgi:hypothetical protein